MFEDRPDVDDSFPGETTVRITIQGTNGVVDVTVAADGD